MIRTIVGAAFVALLMTPTAYADGGQVPPVTDPMVQKECGSCHMTFQPAFLPARSWNKIMDGLNAHFGDDASLPPDKAKTIRAYLTQHAGDVAATGKARKYMQWIDPHGTPMRITENPAFTRKHRFPDKVWKSPKVVTKSNCAACHGGAERGWYEDD